MKPMILADNETKVDLLNNEPIASTIIKLLRTDPDRPVTIGVHGDWGAGKSSILEMIEAGFAAEDKVLCLKFNGWRFQGFEDAKIALLEGIVNGLLEKRPTLTKATQAVKDVFNRIDWLKVAKKAGGLAFTAFTGIPAVNLIDGILKQLQELATDPAKLATKENMESLIESTQGLLKPAQTRHIPEEIQEFRVAFDNLLSEAGIEQLVVLVDDLDRCLPDTAIETLEAIRLFVFTSRTAFVIAADEAMIEYAVRKHFPDLPDTTRSQTYARNYLEKLIQVPFRIPTLGETETRIYVTLLLIGAKLTDADTAFGRLIDAARDRLQQPWKFGALDVEIVKNALDDKAEVAMEPLALSDQIGPVLARGTSGNPRQVKRFLNTLLLRQRIAEARGFESEIKLPVLAKLMLAERFHTRFFDQLASAAAAAPDGKCTELSNLENFATEPDASKETAGAPSDSRTAAAKVKTSSKVDPATTQPNTILTEWLNSEPTRNWAAVQPKIGGEDLRPYLFITKDRKDYFGAASPLGHLADIVERLCGPRVMVQTIAADLSHVAADEAEKIFEAIRSRIMLNGVFDTEPEGIAGLELLVKGHQALQSNLLDFLEALPVARLGPWACSGWGGAINDPDMNHRFDKILDTWSKEGGQTLKAVAIGTLKTRKEGR